MQRRHRVVLASAAMGAAGIVIQSWQPAVAACHSFTVSADPAQAAEGATVTVTVSRDAGVAPSQVDVAAVSESATSGEDFAAFSQTVSFSNGTSQAFPLTITDDDAAEGAETFRLHLSNPQGCAVNPNLVVGPDAVVAITASDAAATTQPTAPPTTPAPPPSTTGTTRGAASTSTSATTATSSTSSTSSSTTTEPLTTTTAGDATDEAAGSVDDEDGGGGSGAAVLGLVVAIAATVGGIGYVVWRRRATSTPAG